MNSLRKNPSNTCVRMASICTKKSAYFTHTAELLTQVDTTTSLTMKNAQRWLASCKESNASNTNTCVRMENGKHTKKSGYVCENGILRSKKLHVVLHTITILPILFCMPHYLGSAKLSLLYIILLVTLSTVPSWGHNAEVSHHSLALP